MKIKVELTQELIKSVLHYNKHTGDFTWKFRGRDYFKCNQSFLSWNKRFAGEVAGTKVKRTWTSYLAIVINGHPFRAHRLAMIYAGHDLKEKDIVDHINGNGLDNKYDNLRVVNFESNSKNARKASNNTSGVTGVSYIKNINKWRASGMKNKSRCLLGNFKNKDDAINARKNFEKENGYHENHGKERNL